MFLGTLYPTQKEGAQFLCAKKRALLAWEQGTGKTIIALASAEKLSEASYLNNVLVVAPSSITWQWQEKIEEFTDSSSSLVEAKNKEARKYESGSFYTVTSYPLFRRDFEVISKHRWGAIITDEAQEFKNNRSKTSKFLKQLNLAAQPDYRWALTGTVISNKLEELYSIMYWVEKGFLPPWPTFEKRHIVRNPHTKQIMSYKGLESLSLHLSKRMNRKTQADLKDQMPDLVQQVRTVPKPAELRAAELTLLDNLEEMSESLSDHPSPKVAKSLSEVRQLLATDEKLSLVTQLIKEIYSENQQNRVVVYYYYKEPLERLGIQLHDVFPCYKFTGDQQGDEKQHAIKQFKESQSVLLASNAGKAGLDLPFANYVIHLDVPFSWEVLDQRNKRITRASSKFNTVKAVFVVVENSIELYYYQAVRRKGLLADAVYHGTTDKLNMKPLTLRNYLNGTLREQD